jgi:hypothetical protein
VLVRLILVVALLAGWQAALQHPVEHVDRAGGFVHGAPGDSPEKAPLCDSLAALTACASSAAAVVPACVSHFPVAQTRALEPRAAEAPPFLAQGPPASV